MTDADSVEDAVKIERCIDLQCQIEYHRAQMSVLARERQQLLIELRQSGYGLQRLALFFGLSKSRIQQIARLP